MVDALGWLNIGLIALMFALFPIKRSYLKYRKSSYLKVYRKVRVFHPLLGLIIIIIGLVHGFLALGTIKLHTGTLVLISIITMGLISTLGRKKIVFTKTRFSCKISLIFSKQKIG